MKWTLRLALSAFPVFFSIPSFAGYLSILESGEVLPASEYQFGVGPQILLNEGGGATVDAFVDAPINDASSFRVVAGGGKVDFYMGGLVKYIPYPDIDRQPAIGVRGGAWYARTDSQNVLTIQIAPLFSRKVDTEIGVLVPYVAIPLNFVNQKDNNHTGLQVVGGTEWRSPNLPNILFAGELALNLNQSYSALNFSAAFPFDGERGFRKR